MLSFFETLIEYVQLVWGFFLNFIECMLTLISVVVGSIPVSAHLPVMMWTPIAASCTIVIALGFIKLLFGRSSI